MLRTIGFLVLPALALFLGISSPLAAQTIQEDIFHARDRVLPALVHIQPVITNYTTGELEKQAVIGSGVVFHTDGYVVTNYHVAGKATRIYCTLADKELVPATFVGGDPLTDLAVIKLDLTNYHGTLHAAEFGNSDSVQAGQYVLAMGSPLSLSRSISVGVVSTKDRYFSPEVRLPSGERTGRYNLWIQTDAAINPGNSGGPLVDLTGRVIGINSRATMFANNLGFAIPINIVKDVTHKILTEGGIVRSWIGLHCQALQELEGFFGTNPGSGVLIASIDPGSPAEKAFLKAGDIILSINDKPVSARFVEELPAFYGEIASKPPGTQLTLAVRRGAEEFTIDVTTRQLGDMQGEDFEVRGWGFSVKAITKQMAIENQLRDTLGVLVVGVKSVGMTDDGGLRRDDVITSLNSKPVPTLSDFVAVYEQLEQERADKALATLKRNGGTRYVVLSADRPKEEAPGE